MSPTAPPVRPTSQQALHTLVAPGLEALDARLRTAVEGATDEERRTLRPDGGWSVGQVLEHLVYANTAYLRGLERLVANGPREPVTAATPWRPTLVGRLLVRSLERPRALPAPSRSRPGPSPREGVFDELLETHRAVRALMTQVADRRWDRMRMPSPLARWLSLNFGDACFVILRHGERHAGQIERTIAALRAR